MSAAQMSGRLEEKGATEDKAHLPSSHQAADATQAPPTRSTVPPCSVFRLHRERSLAWSTGKSTCFHGCGGKHTSMRRSVGAHKGLVRRLGLDLQVAAHEGCVNTVNWDVSGKLLVSGSDDTRICIYSYERRRRLALIRTPHFRNIFCTRFLNDDPSTIVSCGADGRVIVHHTERNQSNVLFDNGSLYVNKLALLSDSPTCFMSCCSEGTVRLFDLRERRSGTARNILVATAPSLSLHSISSSTLYPEYFVVGGNNGRVYDRRKLQAGGQAVPLWTLGHEDDKHTEATGVAFNHYNGAEVVVSYNPISEIYVYDIVRQTRRALCAPREQRLWDPVYDAKARLYCDKRGRLANARAGNDSSSSSSSDSSSGDSDTGADQHTGGGGAGDLESKEAARGQGAAEDIDPALAPWLGTLGGAIANSRVRIVGPALKGPTPQSTPAPIEPTPVAFKGHRNVRTIKAVNFFGPRAEYVVSGSDCGSIFIWDKGTGELVVRIPDADVAVVNCIVPHPTEMALASSGIAEDFKVWRPNLKQEQSLDERRQQAPPHNAFASFLRLLAASSNVDITTIFSALAGSDDDDEEEEEEEDAVLEVPED